MTKSWGALGYLALQAKTIKTMRKIILSASKADDLSQLGKSVRQLRTFLNHLRGSDSDSNEQSSLVRMIDYVRDAEAILTCESWEEIQIEIAGSSTDASEVIYDSPDKDLNSMSIKFSTVEEFIFDYVLNYCLYNIEYEIDQ